MSPDRFRPFVSSTTFGFSSRSKRAQLTLSLFRRPWYRCVRDHEWCIRRPRPQGTVRRSSRDLGEKESHPAIVSDRHSSLSFVNDKGMASQYAIFNGGERDLRFYP